MSEGLTRQIKSNGGDELWVVNPKELALVTDSVIPSKKATHPASDRAEFSSGEFGIAPVAVKSSDLTSEHRLSISYNGLSVAQDKFKFTALKRKAPKRSGGSRRCSS